MKTNAARRLQTVIVAAIGTAIAYALGLPLPFLFGPMFACLAAALGGMQLKGLGQISVGARTILGVAVGASITPDVIGQLPQMAMSVALIPPYIALIALIGVPFFSRLCRLDRTTAYYAAMPGGLQDMVVFGGAAGGDVRALSLIHATRVLVIVTIAPIVLTSFFGASLDQPMGEPAADLPAFELIVMAFAAIIGWKGGERIGLFGASILGPLIVTAILSLMGIIHYRPPSEAILAAQFFIGMGIGVSYVGVTLVELRRVVASAIAFVLILAALTALLTEIVILIGLAAPTNAFLAFAPGGQAELTVLAIVSGADLGYVIAHHLTRIVVVIIGAPLAVGLFAGRRRDISVPEPPKPPD